MTENQVEKKAAEIHATMRAFHLRLKELGCDGIVTYVSFRGRMGYLCDLDNQNLINMSVLGLKEAIVERERLMQMARETVEKPKAEEDTATKEPASVEENATKD